MSDWFKLRAPYKQHCILFLMIIYVMGDLRKSPQIMTVTWFKISMPHMTLRVMYFLFEFFQNHFKLLCKWIHNQMYSYKIQAYLRHHPWRWNRKTSITPPSIWGMFVVCANLFISDKKNGQMLGVSMQDPEWVIMPQYVMTYFTLKDYLAVVQQANLLHNDDRRRECDREQKNEGERG